LFDVASETAERFICPSIEINTPRALQEAPAQITEQLNDDSALMDVFAK
jgi:hypothetical protein